ncbi:MAG: chorismate--pyruvate lyase family protein [Acidiferrobacterales bacterium]
MSQEIRKQHFNIKSEAIWIPRSRILGSHVPSTVLDWLLDKASLTKRLQNACQGKFSVRVLSQGWSRPMLNEAHELGINPHRLALIRQVELLCDNTPWVCARTIIPGSTLSGPLRKLAHLQSQSLGAILFASPTMQRGEVEISNISSDSKTHQLLARCGAKLPESLWGRRSVFRVFDKPLLVCEFFLPTLEKLHF